MREDVRWKQRLENFEKAFHFLAAGLSKETLSELERAGVIQAYEFTFELAWKTMKDYLNEKQVEVRFPRDVIKEAFHYEIIDDGELWLDMLEKRNVMAHTYQESNAELAIRLIQTSYFSAIQQLHERMSEIHE
jgi:nucleotidyltransferase substrate binding protein (TIGR01987 family)